MQIAQFRGVTGDILEIVTPRAESCLLFVHDILKHMTYKLVIYQANVFLPILALYICAVPMAGRDRWLKW